MKRTNDFEKRKIYKASTNKVVTNVYMDAFGIEKVRFQNASYEEKTSIDIYLDFAKLTLLAEDVRSGRIFKKLENDKITVTMGGSKSSENYNGQPESRIMSLGRKDDKIFINMTCGLGKLGPTGLIIPDGQPDKKISVGMTIDDFRTMILYTDKCVSAYLSYYIPDLVYQFEEERKSLNN